MNVTTYARAEGFLQKVQTTLEQDEVINGLMLGLALRVKRNPDKVKAPPYFATVTDDQGLVLAASMTPPAKLILYSPQNEYHEAMELLAQNLIVDRWPVPGASGSERIAEAFAPIWAKHTGTSFRQGMQMLVYELRTVIPPAMAVHGQMRAAIESDTELVTQFVAGFHNDAHLEPMPLTTAHELAADRIQAGDIYLWEDAKVVSMAAKSRPTTNGITVNLVYTPPELRGKGYASACVAALSQHLLDSGYKFCMLFTDVTNPTSNSIYQKIGYRLVGGFNEVVFAAPTTGL